MEPIFKSDYDFHRALCGGLAEATLGDSFKYKPLDDVGDHIIVKVNTPYARNVGNIYEQATIKVRVKAYRIFRKSKGILLSKLFPNLRKAKIYAYAKEAKYLAHLSRQNIQH